MIKAVIFDLDGVLVTTDVLHFNAWKKLAEELGITNFTKEDNARQRGVSRMASLEVVRQARTLRSFCRKRVFLTSSTQYVPDSIRKSRNPIPKFF